MFLRVAATLFFFSTFAVAQIYAPTCKSASYQWTFNSLGQSPCNVTAYMMSTCNGGKYTISPLPPGYHYSGPNGPENADLCHCSTVGYSLFSACVACQGEEWVTWSEWTSNCTKTRTLSPGLYPNPVPSGIRLPHWTVLDVTYENNWNPNKSHADISSPEFPPGSILGPSSVSSSTTPTSSSASSTTSPVAPLPPAGGNSNTGAIAGGVVGGVAAILIAVVVIFYIRRHSRERSAVSAVVGPSYPERPLSDGGTYASSSLPMSPVAKLYDPIDSTTFPTPSHIGSGTTLAHAQPSHPQDGAYHGHPIV